MRIPIPVTGYDMPLSTQVAKALRRTHEELRRSGALSRGQWCDVRLQVYENGEWALRTGMSDYDQDHRGFWGHGAFPFAKSAIDFTTMARGLVAMAADQAAEQESANRLRAKEAE